MPNLLLQNLQNLLNNQNKKINLLSKEYENFQVTEEQNKSFENIFLTTSIVLTTILSLLTYFNYQTNLDISVRYEIFKNNLELSENIGISKSELQARISSLEKYRNASQDKIKQADFFSFLNQITNFLNQDEIVDLTYKQTGKKIEYALSVNSSRINLIQDLNTYFQENLKPFSIEKTAEIALPNSNNKQYQFKGIYEIR
jgi:hypothetical protein